MKYIVDIEAMVQFQRVKEFFPCRSNLRGNVYPQTLDPDVVNTPEI